jgi:hypothetical protein
MSAALEQRLHDLTSAEEHQALRWIHDHAPEVFARAADHVDQTRRLAADGVRKESRS